MNTTVQRSTPLAGSSDATHLRVDALLHAPPELVWDAWTTSRHLRVWTAAGSPDPMGTWRVREACRPEKLVLEVGGGGAYPLTLRTLRLAETAKGGTLLSLSVGFHSSREREDALRDDTAGQLRRSLERLTRYLDALGWGPDPGWEGDAEEVP